MERTTKKDKAFAARIPMDLYKKVRHYAAEEDLSTNAALCSLLEKALYWERVAQEWLKRKQKS